MPSLEGTALAILPKIKSPIKSGILPSVLLLSDRQNVDHNPHNELTR
jgi:hypothetical protein|tara:strand:- start:380 stop:520 length:141 start_codon:yes stop_codon:yes gene_type:complete